MPFHLSLRSYHAVSALTLWLRARSISVNSTDDEIPALYARVQQTTSVGVISESPDTTLTICVDTSHQTSSAACSPALSPSRVSLGPRR